MAMKLKAARVNAGLTQQQACIALGISKSTLSNYENYITKPDIEMAKKIAEKFERRRQMLSEKKGAQQQSNKVAILSRYVSILAVGQKKDINQLLNYTVYQLFTVFKTFEKKYAYDIYLKAQLTVASGMKEVKHWME